MKLSQNEKIEKYLAIDDIEIMRQAIRFLLAGDKDKMMKIIEEFSKMYTIEEV
jgi:hypothetical protein